MRRRRREVEASDEIGMHLLAIAFTLMVGAVLFSAVFGISYLVSAFIPRFGSALFIVAGIGYTLVGPFIYLNGLRRLRAISDLEEDDLFKVGGALDLDGKAEMGALDTHLYAIAAVMSAGGGVAAAIWTVSFIFSVLIGHKGEWGILGDIPAALWVGIGVVITFSWFFIHLRVVESIQLNALREKELAARDTLRDSKGGGIENSLSSIRKRN